MLTVSHESVIAIDQTEGKQIQPADGPDSFVQGIQNSDLFQLVGVLSNFAGVLGIISTVTGVISFLEGLGEPDNAAILNAINQLSVTLNSDFLQLGDLITQQAQATQETVNRDALAAALAQSDTASNAIQAFLASGNIDALNTATTYSTLGSRFFTELNLTSPTDLYFFLPGLIKAASIRLFVIASEPLNLREPQPVLVNDINSMVALLTTMIDSIQSTINAAHVVTTKSHMVQCSVIPQIVDAAAPAFGQPHRNVQVIDGYYHQERVTDNTVDPPAVSYTSFEFFDAQQGTLPCEQPSPFQAEALKAAQQARSNGVAAELVYIGVPYFQQVLQAWTVFLTAVLKAPTTA